MRVIRQTDPDFDQQIAALRKTGMPSPDLEKRVREVLDDIRSRGDAALVRWTAEFGGPKLQSGDLAVGAEEIARARMDVSAGTVRALRAAHRNVRDFAKKSLRKNWSRRNLQGAKVGERFDPFQRVGIYVPGGTAPLVSTAIMTVTLAEAAGVPEIVVTTPADKNGAVNAALLCALQIAGATEIYRVGGIQAVGALAYGTRTIRPVQKVFGPGNAYVVEAKRQVFGQVGVDLLPGPSEVLVMADAGANPAWVAADLLAQAEHGKGSRVGLLTDSPRLASAVAAEIERQLQTLQRREHLEKVLADSTFVAVLKNLRKAVEIANLFAPEHLLIMAKGASGLAKQVRTAGAIFIGGWSPVVVGDFLAGPSHELPTGGAGHSFGGLTVDQFQRRTSIVELGQASLRESLDTVLEFSRIEGLDAHGRSAVIRFIAPSKPEKKGGAK